MLFARINTDLVLSKAELPPHPEQQRKEDALKQLVKALQRQDDDLDRKLEKAKQTETRLLQKIADDKHFKVATGQAVVRKLGVAVVDDPAPLSLRVRRQRAWEEAHTSARGAGTTSDFVATKPRPSLSSPGQVNNVKDWSFAEWLNSIGISEMMSDCIMGARNNDVGLGSSSRSTSDVEKAFRTQLVQLGSDFLSDLIAAAAPVLGSKIVERAASSNRSNMDAQVDDDSSLRHHARNSSDENLPVSAHESAIRSFSAKFADVPIEEVIEDEEADAGSIMDKDSIVAPPRQQTLELYYGTQADWSAGLGALIGPCPSRQEWENLIEVEHLHSEDSFSMFISPNYGCKTFSAAEFYFVRDPVEGLRKLNLTRYPQEANLMAEPELKCRCRQPRQLKDFEEDMRQINARLAQVKSHRRLDKVHLLALRLYTGACFVKYNGVCRAASADAPPFFVRNRDALCQSNRYVATIHAINDGIQTLTPLTRCEKVYRGISSGHLPPHFLRPDMNNLCLGVEFGFLSTTTNLDTALEYASRSSGILFELSMSLRDRAADLSFLSQYPHEAELTFAPLLALDLRDSRVMGDVLIAEIRPTVPEASTSSSRDELATVTRKEPGMGEYAQIAAELGLHLVDRALEEHDIVRAHVDADNASQLSHFISFEQR